MRESQVHQVPALKVTDVSLRFGGVLALDGVSFTVESGEVCGLIGPNGAGKSSLFNCVSGLYRPDEGSIVYGDAQLAGLSPHRTARLGVGRTFQNLAFAESLSIVENVMLAGNVGQRPRPLAQALRTPRARREEVSLRRRSLELLDRVGVGDVADRLPGEVSFGTAKRVEIARALLAEPSLLLVDEPAGGLNHDEVDSLTILLRDVVRELALTLLVVEHHIGFVASLCDSVVVLDGGRWIAEGTPAEIQANPDVIRAYLGVAP